MELLLIFSILISPNAVAGEVERFERRAAGFDAHLQQQRMSVRDRQKAAEQSLNKREAYEKRYNQARQSFDRKPRTAPVDVENRFERQQAEREKARLQIQQAFARKQKEAADIIEPKAQKLMPREYGLESGTK